MQLSRISLGVVAATAAVMAACKPDRGVSSKPLPAALATVAAPSTSTVVGELAGTFSVKVTDKDGAAVSGALVNFTISVGGGRVSPTTDTTDSDGTASTALTVGTTPGANEVTAVVRDVAPVKAASTGVVGATQSVALAPTTLRFPMGVDDVTISGAPRDVFRNATGQPITWTPRDPTLISATPLQPTIADVAVLRRPGQTYLVATSGGVSDSVLVSVQDASSTACTFFATPNTLAVGESVAFESGPVCIRATDPGAEYGLVAQYSTAVFPVSARVEVTGIGLATAPPSFPSMLSSASVLAPAQSPTRDFDFERRLRLREQREIAPYVASARAWFKGSRAAASRSALPAIKANVREGDLLQLNVNANEFCGSPTFRTARVVAVTNGTVVMADTSNPAGGFTDAEYRAFGIAMDTLVNPVDTAAFGVPADVDGNGRVGILFTKAVNELTPASAGSVVLGFYYVRDLLPRVSPFGDCPGSNTGEMFYLLVPDPDGTVNSNARSKSFVQNIVVATIGHEYQHLINASRRMYINEAPQVDEEVWLNEGLSHIAEELLFYRASGLEPRQNIDASQVGLGAPAQSAFDTFQRGNFGRYREFLKSPEGSSPISPNDALSTRGATWSFLRYLVDRTRTSDGNFWKLLVNSKLIGLPNIDEALSGTQVTVMGALRDWSVSVFADDLMPNTSPAFQQPSWNFLSAMSATGVAATYPLFTRILTDRAVIIVFPAGGATSYMRFAVAQNQEALIQVNGGGGGPTALGVRVTIVRMR